MGKFRIRVKLQGFELEMDGDREDIPAISSALQKQIGGLVSPPDPDVEPNAAAIPGTVIDMTAPKRGSRKRAGGGKSSSDTSSSSPIDFRHDSAKFGNPKQSWTVVQKAIWLMYVLGSMSETKEFSANQLTATFNQQFKATGKIHPPHMPQKLTQAKVSNPAPVGEDKGLWYLTAEGTNQAVELVKQAQN